MRFAVIGASGRIGRRIAAEAGARGHAVTAVVRTAAGHPAGTVVADVFDPAAVATAIGAVDVVVNAAGHAAGLPDRGFYVRAAQSLVAAARECAPAGPRLLIVGGFGSLLEASGRQYADRPGLPEQAAPEIVGQRDALTYYRTVADVRWTYLSPPPGGIAPGERTGSYRVAVDGIGVAPGGAVSMEDFAVAVVDEAERDRYPFACLAIAY